MKRTARSTIFAAIAAATLVLAGCSSEGDTASETTTPAAEETTAESEGESTDAAGEANECVATSQAVVDKWTAEVPLIGPSQQIDMAANSGKEYWLLLTLVNQFSGAIADGFENAAEAAGVKGVVFDGKGTVNEWNKGLNQAVAQGADAIILWGIPPELVQEGLQAAVDAGIPVIDSVNGSVDDPLQPGVLAHVDVNAFEWGDALASWMLVESDCNANVGVVWPPAFGGLDKIANQTRDTLAERCPECQFVSAEMDVANLATTLPEQTRTMLTANPDLNFFTPLFDSAVTFAAPVVEEFSGVQIGSHDGVPSSLDMVRAGGPQTMDMTYPPNEYLGWSLLSIVAGLSQGLEPDPALLRIPERMVTSENIPATNEEIWPAYVDFQPTFLEAWGIN
jgi:ABC-type sugar transport system substrate-binding protein